ncbi:MAG: sodium:proton antiporter [Gammaproteobacteria bacterium]|nr:sodium:proton antiporter [Gammaproteobacteria bacterium]
MDLASLVAAILTLSAAFAYLNFRFIGLPTTIGVMLIALALSAGLLALGWLGVAGLPARAARMLAAVNFDKTLMDGMLSFLLFAGALHVNSEDLARKKWSIGLLATAGVLLSTFIVGALTFHLLAALGLPAPFVYCLLFGALISPTDPIAVLATLKKAGIAKTLEVKIAGESLFNDGVGVVVFIVILGIVQQAGGAEGAAGPALVVHALETFLWEALGGIAFGYALGRVGYYLLKSVDNYQVEILLTLALVMGGYTLAHAVHVSGPIAVVVAGLLIGNRGRHAMPAAARARLNDFWELLDEILNVVLFVLIGLEALILHWQGAYLAAGLLAIPLVLLARLASVGAPISLLRAAGREFSENAVKILVWGGLKGGISVALALTLPAGPERDVFLVMTYIVVIFSITVQGLTVGRVARRLSGD